MKRSEMVFERGAILHREMLADLYEYPRIADASRYAAYSDGILYGLEWQDNEEKPGCHIVTPGALKLQGEIYFLAEQMDIEDNLEDLKLDNRYYLFFIKQEEKREIKARVVYPLRLSAVQSEGLAKAKQEGFYFAYTECQADGRLALIDDERELYGLLAAKDGYAFRISSQYASRVLRDMLTEKKNKHPLDYLLLKDLLEKRGISVGFVKLYLREAGIDWTEKETDNPKQLWEKFKEACTVLQCIEQAASIRKDTEKVPVRIRDTVIHSGGSL